MDGAAEKEAITPGRIVIGARGSPMRFIVTGWESELWTFRAVSRATRRETGVEMIHLREILSRDLVQAVLRKAAKAARAARPRS